MQRPLVPAPPGGPPRCSSLFSNLGWENPGVARACHHSHGEPLKAYSGDLSWTSASLFWLPPASAGEDPAACVCCPGFRPDAWPCARPAFPGWGQGGCQSPVLMCHLSLPCWPGLVFSPGCVSRQKGWGARGLNLVFLNKPENRATNPTHFGQTAEMA